MKFTNQELNSVSQMLLSNILVYFEAKSAGLPVNIMFPEFFDENIIYEEFSTVLQFVGKCRQYLTSDTMELVLTLNEILENNNDRK